jgi:hypothetical protein
MPQNSPDCLEHPPFDRSDQTGKVVFDIHFKPQRE